MTEQVSARTLRKRHEEILERLERMESHVVMLIGHVERLVTEKHALERAVETLKQVPHLTGWTKQQEASLIMGLSDAQLRRAAIEAQREG